MKIDKIFRAAQKAAERKNQQQVNPASTTEHDHEAQLETYRMSVLTQGIKLINQKKEQQQ